MALRYTPATVPKLTNLEGENLQVLLRFIRTELENIAAAHNQTLDIQLDPLGVEPAKRQDGMIRYANGTDWNPGSGTGAYVRISATWVRFG